MLPEQFRDMTTDQRRAHFARLRERRARDAPLPDDPLAASRDRIRLNKAIQQEYIMKTTITGKKDLSEIATASVAAAAKIEAIRVKFKKDSEVILHEHDATLAALSPTDRLQMQRKLQPSIDAKLKALRDESAEARATILADLKTAKTLADEYGPHLGDARTVASMYGISSAEKQRALAELENAGPMVVKSAALQAKMMLADPKTAHEGKILASAVLTRNAAIDKAYRQIKDPNAYAALCFANEISDVQNYTTGIARSLATALAAERDIIGTGTNPNTKISIGRQFPNEKLTPRADIDDEGSDDLPLDKISRGLAELKA